ncbi:fibrinogen-like protein 1 isoform X2 [Mercenaria mercenaria]|nr:fibrinogen-like protein 1 isoform X2 [Mercenaria mercenaria]
MANIWINSLCLVLVAVALAFGHEQWTCTPNTNTREYRELEEKVRVFKQQIKQLPHQQYPKDCGEIYSTGTKTDGVYTISPDKKCSFSVYCDMTNGGWTLIQRKADASVDFNRPWTDYVAGFGNLTGSHWLGLEKIHRMTKDGSRIYFEIGNYDGSRDHVSYEGFAVQGKATAYTMNVDRFGYEGTIKELFSRHNNQKFSTYDRDNDDHSTTDCVGERNGAGWWYHKCSDFGDFNAVYGTKVMGGIGYWNSGFIPIKDIVIKIKEMDGHC